MFLCFLAGIPQGDDGLWNVLREPPVYFLSQKTSSIFSLKKRDQSSHSKNVINPHHHNSFKKRDQSSHSKNVINPHHPHSLKKRDQSSHSKNVINPHSLKNVINLLSNILN